MKLEKKLFDKFDELGIDFTRGVSMKEFAKECELIADDFAIGFMNWGTTYKANDRNNWHLSTNELLEIYKKEAKL